MLLNEVLNRLGQYKITDEKKIEIIKDQFLLSDKNTLSDRPYLKDNLEFQLVNNKRNLTAISYFTEDMFLLFEPAYRVVFLNNDKGKGGSLTINNSIFSLFDNYYEKVNLESIIKEINDENFDESMLYIFKCAEIDIASSYKVNKGHYLQNLTTSICLLTVNEEVTFTISVVFKNKTDINNEDLVDSIFCAETNKLYQLKGDMTYDKLQIKINTYHELILAYFEVKYITTNPLSDDNENNNYEEFFKNMEIEDEKSDDIINSVVDVLGLKFDIVDPQEFYGTGSSDNELTPIPQIDNNKYLIFKYFEDDETLRRAHPTIFTITNNEKKYISLNAVIFNTDNIESFIKIIDAYSNNNKLLYLKNYIPQEIFLDYKIEVFDKTPSEIINSEVIGLEIYMSNIDDNLIITKIDTHGEKLITVYFEKLGKITLNVSKKDFLESIVEI